jgi:hypothetical protein
MDRKRVMKVVYRIVEHDGGWAYRVGDVYSETFESHDEARAAAERAAEEPRQGGETTGIEFETADGKWHHQLADGGDRPETAVEEGDGSDRE